MNYNLKLQAYKISQIAVDTKLIKDGKEELAIECFVSPKFPLNGDDDTLLLAFNASVYEKDKKDAEKIVSATAEFIYECNMHPEDTKELRDYILDHCLDEIQDIAFEHINRIFETMNFTGLKIEASE